MDMPLRIRIMIPAFGVFLLIQLCAVPAFSYSVLSHEEIVDLLWVDSIQPNLLARFPKLTQAQLQEAHAYAYGGSVIQDLGYYPFGNKEFTNLVHYVRSGDFVREMLRQSQDANEYAFAMGALAHYTSDFSGHPAVNQAVAMQYPKLRKKYGDSVTFAQSKSAHLKTEFSFDVLQVAKHRYVSEEYHNFIGFEVSKPLLERVFQVVYGQKLDDVLPRLDLTIRTYRYAASQFIPELTKVAVRMHKDDLPADSATPAQRLFMYRIPRIEFEKEWGKDYYKPKFFFRLLGTIVKLIPKIGPLKTLQFRDPTPETEELYIRSINTTVERYRNFLNQIRQRIDVALQNLDLDTGNHTVPMECILADETYQNLLLSLSEQHFESTSSALRNDILKFFSTYKLPTRTRSERKRRQKIQESLNQLTAFAPR